MTEDKKDDTMTVTFADEDGVEMTFVASKSIEIVCVCGRQVIAGDVTDGTSCIIHVEPRCRKFEELEPDEFLAYLRRHYSKEIN